MFQIAIVGRPNVGKSALFNRIVGRTISIVHDQPGVTRDRISAVVERNRRQFEFVDTGGIGLFESDITPAEIAAAVRMQAEIAIESADLILLVADGQEGLRPLDEEIIARLRRSGKKPWLVVNKLDLPMHEIRAAEFSRLGVEPLFTVSAAHGRGVDRLWKAIEKAEGARSESAAAGPLADTKHGAEAIQGNERQGCSGDSRPAVPAPRIAIVGRPNVGKSSLVNRLLGAQRVIVSEAPGTTRDSVEMTVEFRGRHYVLIDTAGIRARTKVRSNVEMYSRHWAEKSVARCDIVLLMLSAPDGPTRQDQEIASMALKHEKPCILLINKWDLNETIEKRAPASAGGNRTPARKRRGVSRSEYEKALRAQMPFLDYAPLMFISALQGYHALAIWEKIERVNQSRNVMFTTGVLNRIFERAQERVQPPMNEGRRLKIYYVTQKAGAPAPTFVVFVNRRRLWMENYARYLMNQLRRAQPMEGCPIIFRLRERAESAAPDC
ncbi:MAG: ribosome biogenesis GTPase Der [Verrucomicrobia bacterium]|nr:ribosome biogenesis GTPase Der [Verrucomicrobiota bacterium]